MRARLLAPAGLPSMACARRDTALSERPLRQEQRPSSAQRTVPPTRTRPPSTDGSVSQGISLWSVAAKSAAVPHPDGSHRRLYCLESPESWFEDFGSGVLECGRALVAIDPDFAALVNLDDYQVFVTEYDRQSDLCVADRTPTGFRVQARHAAAEGPFGWRIVARRKDINAERLATVTIPPEPTLPPAGYVDADAPGPAGEPLTVLRHGCHRGVRRSRRPWFAVPPKSSRLPVRSESGPGTLMNRGPVFRISTVRVRVDVRPNQ
jgi:hypothetical protein